MDALELKAYLAEVKQKFTEQDHIRRLEIVDQAISSFRKTQDDEEVVVQTELRELTNKIASLRAECSRSALDWIAHEEHVERVHALEREQAEWGKKIEADEAKLRGIEAELRSAKEECAEWEAVSVEEEVEFSGDALALRFFRNLGFVPSYDPAKLKAAAAAAAISTASKRNGSRASAAAAAAAAGNAAAFDRVLVRSESTGRATMFDVSAQGRARKGLDEREMAAQLWAAAR
ncbi:hypothetical protein OC834_000277 [Tilletia horrida]|uniref:Kinetochore protein Spc24 n=1 Tax=Tilletia horrida TaxID=155126 RepID=A0AAN6JMJ8_9BASI|nr:hypothetical protein OC834_000277 [Tilletia horrida]KAK0539118.1 hypothetical protein OC842_001052 [Tilletia horrida]KAK0563843.1 hypothetical protein OC844_002021 [Tilletia horrida]